MKKEIFSVHVGECGVRLGDKFLEFLTYDHGITPIGTYWESNPSQTSNIDVFFRTTKTHAKALLYCVDLDSETDYIINNSTFRQLYDPEKIYFGMDNSGTNSNYATAYYNQKSKDLIDRLAFSMCEEAELSEGLQGFQIIHSLGGGTGSGLTCLLLENMADTYPKQIVTTCTVLPSPWISNEKLESYNFMLSLPILKEHTNYNILLDNESVCKILVRNCYRFKPQLSDINHIMANAIAGITTTFRFPSEINGTLRKLYINMVPKKELHLLVPSITPTLSTERIPHPLPTESTLAYEIFRTKNCLTGVDLLTGRTLTMATVFRGPMNPKDIENCMTKAKHQYSQVFLNWVHHNVSSQLSVISLKSIEKCASSVMNTSAVKDMFSRIEERFIANIKRRYKFHYYTQQGMDEAEFEIAHGVMLDWVDDYVDYCKDHNLKTVNQYCGRKEPSVIIKKKRIL